MPILTLETDRDYTPIQVGLAINALDGNRGRPRVEEAYDSKEKVTYWQMYFSQIAERDAIADGIPDLVIRELQKRQFEIISLDEILLRRLSPEQIIEELEKSNPHYPLLEKVKALAKKSLGR